jgi:DNA-directed RNA polymerase specialized sigma24 family protein
MSRFNNTETASSNDINTMLETLDAYIQMLASKHLPYQLSSSATRDLNVAELAQQIRIKLWQALEKERGSLERIKNVKAYTYTIARHEATNMLRAHKPILPLPVDDDDEINCEHMLINPGEGLQDPLCVLEQAEHLEECINQTADIIEALPKRQQLAMICELKDHIEETLPIINRLLASKKDILQKTWPTEKNDAHSLKVSLSVSRKKLRKELRELYSM